MTQARGSQTVIALYEESAYATTPGTPSGQKLYVTSCGVQAQQNRIDSNTLTGSRERSAPSAGNINVTGPMALELGAESIGTLLKHIMGNNTTTGTGPYTHTMVLGDLPVGFILEKDFGSNIVGSGRVQYFNGCRVARATFSFPQEGYCTASVDIVGAKETLAASALDASLTDNGHTSFSAFSASIQEGGTSIAIVESAEIVVDNGLDDTVFTIGSNGERRALPEGFASVSGSITALFESPNLLAKAVAGTESSLQITLSRGDGLGSAGNESIDFTVNQLLYERVSPPIEGPAGIKITLPFKAYISGATSALQIVLKNAVTTI